ncbi:MAG: ATP synthase F1 subunit gamma [Lachnospiraceae bacterium]|nr:ATP synthase F1 subunit gamma [Lachnospiraceae bacterium]
MASMRDIKRRRASVQSTGQITKAMKLVATVKLQKAKNRALQSKEYFNCMYKTVISLLAKSANTNNIYTKESESKRKAIVVITSNRGLAGGYNSNVVKLITQNEELIKEDLDIYAIGKKGQEFLARRGYNIVEDRSELMEEFTYADAIKVCNKLLASYEKGEVGEIYIAYTNFKNTVSHIPTLLKLLPILETDDDSMDEGKNDDLIMNFEPDDEEALKLIIPKYVASLLHGALIEATAAENGARMQAMDSATNNAEEMIDKLTLKYNRARQGSITQELTEIIAGAEAIS